MTRLRNAALLGVILVTAPLRAQEVSEARVRDAIADGAGGLGQAVAGGSPLTGPAGTTGGLGHLRLGAAATFTSIEIEDPRRSAGTVDFVLPSGALTAALGILGGAGVTGFGSLDVIGRLGTVLPREEIEDSAPLLALGARIGILQGGALLPDVSVTLERAWVTDLTYGEDDDEVSFSGEVRVLSARADVSKSFLLATPYAGVGLDRSEIEADYQIPEERSTGPGEIRGRIDESGTHARAYAGVEIALALLALSVELGTVDGGGSFAALGARLGF